MQWEIIPVVILVIGISIAIKEALDKRAAHQQGSEDASLAHHDTNEQDAGQVAEKKFSKAQRQR